MIRITQSNVAFESEQLLVPFGFKAGYVSELWQSVVALKSSQGHEGVGVGTQSVLWSDSSVFDAHSPSGGNCVMHLMTERATLLAASKPFDSPLSRILEILPEVMEYGRKLINCDDLRTTFALNAMVPLDFAMWQLYAKNRNIQSFDALVPDDVLPAMAHRHQELGIIPLITYDFPISKAVQLVQNGCFFVKIKIGADPDKDKDPEKMLAWDTARVIQIHKALCGFSTPYTESGRVAYYLDANGRYDSLERIKRLLDKLDTAGALEHVLLLEEPFPEESGINVSCLGVRIAADESAHTPDDVKRLISLGYGAITLKPIAKTLSMSFLMAKEAWKNHVPCFCADLTVGPVTLEWNQAFASRLAPLQGLKIGVIESNGDQNYANWKTMLEYAGGAPWLSPQNGIFDLGNDFQGGGIFTVSPHYKQLARLS